MSTPREVALVRQRVSFAVKRGTRGALDQGRVLVCAMLVLLDALFGGPAALPLALYLLALLTLSRTTRRIDGRLSLFRTASARRRATVYGLLTVLTVVAIVTLPDTYDTGPSVVEVGHVGDRVHMYVIRPSTRQLVSHTYQLRAGTPAVRVTAGRGVARHTRQPNGGSSRTTLVAHNTPRSAVVGASEALTVQLPVRRSTRITYVLRYPDGRDVRAVVLTDRNGFSRHAFLLSAHGAPPEAGIGSIGVQDTAGRVLVRVRFRLQSRA